MFVGQCKKCDGGVTKRKRECVSVCDGKTPVYNCYGESEEIVPCNTNQCGQPNYCHDNTNHKIKPVCDLCARIIY